MDFVISTAIGGQVLSDVESNKWLKDIQIGISKILKENFKGIEIAGLQKIKINLYISGDISEYCDKIGISKSKYLKAKNEISTEFCITRDFWNKGSVNQADLQFVEFLKQSLLDLSDFVENKLNSVKISFQKDVFITTVLRSFELYNLGDS
ncbi:Imm12 family immunity protein [Pedobacter caeni]|uniref:Immunity protein 12 n=1 Tax=Pedobacter caeni TaxID=288992 RepID=A0A1M5JR95_9SPHI|nr:Imm12 family immunity protein [Pedobacter caeni]SHG43081.1 Immunity protein 12 [Pedobacter caeni]